MAGTQRGALLAKCDKVMEEVAENQAPKAKMEMLIERSQYLKEAATTVKSHITRRQSVRKGRLTKQREKWQLQVQTCLYLC